MTFEPPGEPWTIAYSERFEGVLPVAAYPLPYPKFKPHKAPIWWLDFLSYAKDYITKDPPEPQDIPRRFRVAPRNKILDSLHADIVVDLDFYTRWVTIPPEEDIEEHFPKGVKVLVESSRQGIIQAVELALSGDWARHVVLEYADALERCRSLCDLSAAVYRGHRSPKDAAPSFRAEHVHAVMKDTRGYTGLVNYSHIRRILLSECTSEDSTNP